MPVGRPLEVGDAVFGDAVVDGAHHLDELALGVVLADDVVLAEEVRRDGDQRVLRPPLEPVHRAAGDEAGELQRTVSELLAHLSPTPAAMETVSDAAGRCVHRRGGGGEVWYL